MKKITIILILAITTLHIDAQQNLGLGTTSPHISSILDITSTTRGVLIPRMTSAQRGAINSPIVGLMVYQTNTSGLNLPGLYFYDGMEWKRFAKSDEIGGGSGSWTVAGNNQYSNVSGNVGIGVSAGIAEKLTLKGDLLVSFEGGPLGGEDLTAEIKLLGSGTGLGKLTFCEPDTSAGASIIYAPISNSLTLRNEAAPNGYLRLCQNGNLGLGITGFNDAVSKLQIIGGDYSNLTDHHGDLMLGPVSGGNLVLSHNEILARFNGGTSTLYLQQEGGSVKIGATGLATGSKLHVTDGAESSLTGNGLFVLGPTTGQNITMDEDEIQSRSNGSDTYLKVQQATGLGMQIGGTSAIITPDTKLYIPLGNDAGLSSDGFIHVGTEDQYNLVIDNNEILARFNNGISPLTLQYEGGDFKVGSDNKIFASNNGNVGIGTGNPLARLDVAGRIRVVNSGETIGMDGNNPNIGLWHNGTWKSKIEQLSGELLISSNQKIHVETSQMAIGTNHGSTGNYKLTVHGRVLCEELMVKLYANWPDYVFADEYPLTPLDELKTFIETNHHLPNIPKSSEVEKEGFEVGEMNRKLLEKVEELTLYVIQLHDKINELEAKN